MRLTPITPTPTACGLLAALTLLLSLAAPAPARAQCEPAWDGRFAPPPLGFPVTAMGWSNLGGVERLMVSGYGVTQQQAERFGSAGWDGEAWGPLPGGIVSADYDALGFLASPRADGPLYAFGTLLRDGEWFAAVAAWDGGSWTPLLTSGGVSLLTAADVGGTDLLAVFARYWNGGGPEIMLFERGEWTTIAAIDGQTDLRALAWVGTGPGLRLVAMGEFESFAGVPANHAAAWDGTAWHDAGQGLDDRIFSAAVVPDASGGTLYAVSRDGLRRWDHTTWTPIGRDAEPRLPTLLGSADLGDGPQLLATVRHGLFQEPTHLWAWNGLAWDQLPGEFDRDIQAVAAAPGPYPYADRLFVGGQFSRIDGVEGRNTIEAVGAAVWDGRAWQSPGTSGPGSPLHGAGTLLAAEAGGPLGGVLYAGGNLSVNEHDLGTVASWDGTRWRSLGLEVGSVTSWVSSLLVADLGEGERLIAAGDLSDHGVHQWDGRAWSVVGPERTLSGSVRDLAVFDAGDGPHLYACGTPLRLWPDTASVVRLGTQGWEIVLPDTQGYVTDMAVFDDGTGPALYACGRDGFDLGQGPVGPVIRWDGAGWQQAGGSLYDRDKIGEGTLLVPIESSGRELLTVSGTFDLEGQRRVGLAVLDGGVWRRSTGDVPDSTYLVGTADTRDGPVAFGVNRENGSSHVTLNTDGGWRVLPGAIEGGSLRALAIGGVDGPGSIYLSGSFTGLGGTPSDGFARYGCPRCPADFDADGDADSADVTAFVTLWTAGESVTDINTDGRVDTRDIVAFLNVWNTGC